MKEELEKQIAVTCKELFGQEIEVELTRPEEQFGDYSTNVALRLSAKIQKPSAEVAEALVLKLKENLSKEVKEVSMAGPGFLNLKLDDQYLVNSITLETPKFLLNQEVIVEFGDANPFKEMHIGHLYTSIVGDAIARLFEASGADVKRVSYHGDIGMHIAKALWSIRKHLKADSSQTIEDFFNSDTSMGIYYAEGAKAYEEDETVKEEIRQINSSIYAQDNQNINDIYNAGKELSFKNFDVIFNDLGISFDKRYLESESSTVGLKIVKDNTPKVFTESDGAVVFKGEKVGLHTRVFINSQGLPTYEAKDLGLTQLKDKDYPNASKSVIITDHQQADYFKVMLAALKEINSNLASKTVHLAHGHLGLTTGKMSSRSGNVFSASTLIEDVLTTINSQYKDSEVKHEVFIAALKYSLLRSRLGSDVIFDVKESVALEGNSGPYLQYAHARAKSIISKVGEKEIPDKIELGDQVFEPSERSLARKLSEYGETLDKTINELMPHHLCTYLYELAQSFNRFYEISKVMGDPRQSLRLSLVHKYAKTLEKGLNLLGIPAPDKM
jgi:arginyl-tRNA synthetase